MGLRAFLVEPGSFRTGIEQRTHFSGEPIEAYEATSGAFRKMMTTVSPDMFPGDPVRAAAAIYEVIASKSPRHWLVLGSDAQRRIGAKLDMLRAEFEAGADPARRTDYPGSAKTALLPAPTRGQKEITMTPARPPPTGEHAPARPGGRSRGRSRRS